MADIRVGFKADQASLTKILDSLQKTIDSGLKDLRISIKDIDFGNAANKFADSLNTALSKIDISESLKGINRATIGTNTGVQAIVTELGEVKTTLGQINTAISDSSLEDMAMRSTAALGQVVLKLQEVSELVESINSKEFNVTQTINNFNKAGNLDKNWFALQTRHATALKAVIEQIQSSLGGLNRSIQESMDGEGMKEANILRKYTAPRNMTTRPGVIAGIAEMSEVVKRATAYIEQYNAKVAEVGNGRIAALQLPDMSRVQEALQAIQDYEGIASSTATQTQTQMATAASEVATAEREEANAARETAVAEQAAADVAHEASTAKQGKAYAALEVSRAEQSEAESANLVISSEAEVADVANTNAQSIKAEAHAAKDAATAERDLADAQKQAAAQDIGDKEKEESVAMRAAYLKELIDLQKQLEVLQINQPDTYLANQQGFDTLISSLGSAIDEGRADLEGWLNELERTGTVSQETIATVRTLAAEIKKVAAIDAAQQKAQNAIADAELRLQQQHARQAVSSTGGKYYDVEGVQALKDAYTTLADDITKAKAASKSMSDETRNGFISRAEDIVRQSEALREQARSAEEVAQETREYQSTVNSAYRESAEIQREEAEAAKAREAAFQRLEAAARKEAEAEEQAAIREGRAMMKAADDAEAAALKREQATQAAELKSIQQQAQQALSNAVKNNVDTSAVEYMRNEVNALSADIQKVTADMSTYSEEVRSGFETRLQLIEQSSHAIQVEADAERARAEAAKQQAQIDTTWQKDQAAQAAAAEREAADQQTRINKVIDLRSAYKEFRQEHQITYQQFQAEMDAYIATMEREGEVTWDQFHKMEDAMHRYREASKTGAERQKKDLEEETTLRQRAMKLLNQTQRYINGNSRAYSLFRGQLDGIVQELNKMASGGPGGGGGGPIDPSRLRAIASELDNIKAAANSAGVSGQTFFEKLKAGWQKFAGWSLVTRSFMLVIRGFKSMINSVKELDSAMTELKKVTDLTAAGYQKFFAQAEQSAMKVGATVSDTINATAD